MDNNNFTIKNAKDNKIIILVEGESDVAFLNLYICNKYGFKYIEDSKMNGQYAGFYGAIYESSKKHLEIFSVGGVGRFNDGFNVLKDLIFTEQVKYLIIIADCDDRTPKEVADSLKFGDIKFENEKYINYKKNDGFNELDFKAYLKTIPTNKSGALENIVIDAIRKEDEQIVSASCDFVDGLGEEELKYIKKRRLKLKAKTGVIFSLISPDRTFGTLTNKFKLVDLNNDVVEENFGFLKDVFE